MANIIQSNQINILDCTLRDSGYAIDFQFSARDTRNIAAGLNKAGIRLIEVGHGLGLGASSLQHGVAFEADADYINSAKTAAPRARLGCFFIPGIGKKESIAQGCRAGLSFIRIGQNITSISEAEPYVEYAKELGLMVTLNLMKTYAMTVSEFSILAGKIAEWPVDIIYIVDSAGCMLPEEVCNYIKCIKNNTAAEAGFHGHNNLGLANANCLAAVKAGATFIDGTLRGMGRSAGNAQTEIISYLIEKQGLKTGVDPLMLFETVARFIEPLMTYPQGLSAMEVVIGMSKFHTSHLPRFKRILDRYEVDLMRLIMEVSKLDCVDPSNDMIDNVARYLSRTEP